jgi:hypothetical protein
VRRPSSRSRGRGYRLLNVCSAIKASGDRCQAQAMRNSQWCYVHNPDLAEQRQRNNRKGGHRGGRGRPISEIADLKLQLEELAASVLDGSVERSSAVVVNQIINTRLRAVDLERKIWEQEELEARIQQLEQAQERGGRRWGA